jgi:hypothetical protein
VLANKFLKHKINSKKLQIFLPFAGFWQGSKPETPSHLGQYNFHMHYPRYSYPHEVKVFLKLCAFEQHWGYKHNHSWSESNQINTQGGPAKRYFKIYMNITFLTSGGGKQAMMVLVKNKYFWHIDLANLDKFVHSEVWQAKLALFHILNQCTSCINVGNETHWPSFTPGLKNLEIYLKEKL